MTIVDNSGMVLKVKWSHTAKLIADDKTINWQNTGVGRVICPECNDKQIDIILPSTRGVNIGGFCRRCKKQYWFDITD